jgi:hypothetical protein
MAKMIAATMASMPICFPYRAGIIGPENSGSYFLPAYGRLMFGLFSLCQAKWRRL